LVGWFLVGELAGCLAGWLVLVGWLGRLVGWLVGCLAGGRLAGWLAAWRAGRLVGWLVGWRAGRLVSRLGGCLPGALAIGLRAGGLVCGLVQLCWVVGWVVWWAGCLADVGDGTTTTSHVSSTAALALKRSGNDSEAGSSSRGFVEHLIRQLGCSLLGSCARALHIFRLAPEAHLASPVSTWLRLLGGHGKALLCIARYRRRLPTRMLWVMSSAQLFGT